MDWHIMLAAYLVIGAVVLGVIGIEGCSRPGVVLIVLLWPLVLAMALGAFIRGALGIK